ncbi:MAG: MATE family efflux transporter [Candidatus Sericytochromatia bacterium]
MSAAAPRSWLFQEIRDSLRLALPMAGTQLAQIALQVVDSMMCGRLGPVALGGVGLGVAALSMIWLPLMAIVQAVAPIAAHAHGAGDEGRLVQAVRQALLLAAGLGLLCIVLISVTPSLLLAIGQPADGVSQARNYLEAARWGMPFALGIAALRGLLDSLGRSRIVLWVTLTGIAVNVLLNSLLIWGPGPFPALGVAGTGWATSLVNAWMFFLLLAYIQSSRALTSYRLLGNWRPQPELLRELLHIGLPMAGGVMAEVWLFSGMAFLMGYFGATAVAAHQIALNLASTSFMLALGVGSAATIRVGHALGREDRLGASRAGWSGMGLGMGLMGCVGLIFWLFPETIIGLYTDTRAPENAELVALATRLLQLAALFQLFDALQVTSQGALRGLKDTRLPMLIGFCAYWGVGLGSGSLLAFVGGLRETGLWLGLVLGLAAAGLALSLRFRWHFRAQASLSPSADKGPV